MPDLTLAELKRVLDKTGDGDDELLELYLAAALEQAQAPAPYGCGRLLVPDPADDVAPAVSRTLRVAGPSRTFGDDYAGLPIRASRRWRVSVPDARAITAVTVDGAAVASSDYDAFTHRGHIVGLAVNAAAAEVTVTGRFGFLAIPDSLRVAIYTLAARAFHERDAGFSDQAAIAEGAPVQAYYRQLPPAVKLVFASFAVPRGVAGLA